MELGNTPGEAIPIIWAAASLDDPGASESASQNIENKHKPDKAKGDGLKVGAPPTRHGLLEGR
jgi:hypothetical protein